MENNKIDRLIKDKFKQRTLSPSASAWERLSNQLDAKVVVKKKRNWFLYVGYAASITVLISVFFLMTKTNNNDPIIPNEIIVVTPADTLKFEQKLFREPIEVEKAIVLVDESSENDIKNRDSSSLVPHSVGMTKENKNVIASLPVGRKGTNNEVISPIKTTVKIKTNVIQNEVYEVKNLSIKTVLVSSQKKVKRQTQSTIKINPDALLYAVTHSKNELQTYYAKHQVKRSEVLQVIKNQLKKSNLKIDPATILAEVERTIDDDYFQNNFLEKVRLKVTDIAVAFADRNNE